MFGASFARHCPCPCICFRSALRRYDQGAATGNEAEYGQPHGRGVSLRQRSFLPAPHPCRSASRGHAYAYASPWTADVKESRSGSVGYQTTARQYVARLQNVSEISNRHTGIHSNTFLLHLATEGANGLLIVKEWNLRTFHSVNFADWK